MHLTPPLHSWSGENGPSPRQWRNGELANNAVRIVTQTKWWCVWGDAWCDVVEETTPRTDKQAMYNNILIPTSLVYYMYTHVSIGP
jgi:hypothetical protein